MSKVIVEGHIRVPLEKLNELRPAIAKHVELSRAEEGNIVFQLEENTEDPGRFDLYEEFVDTAAFEAHKQRTAQSDWAEQGKVVKKNFEVKEVN